MKTKTLLLLLTALFMSYTTAFAMKGNSPLITGSVLDEEKKPLEFVVVALLKAEDSTLVKGMLTSGDGKFSFEGMKEGNYLLAFSLTGFEKKWIGPFIVKETLDYSGIQLNSNKQLKEVTVVAKQPLFVQKPGMMIMNVENSVVRISGTAYDVVSKAPGVSVDQDGNFSLKGKAGVMIYLDGKNTYISGEQLRDYLMNIPASDIVRIEMMTTPPAKYDADGSSGIINVVTMKSKKQGFNNTANVGFGQGNATREEAGLSINYGKPKYNLFAKYDFSTPGRKETKTVNRVVYNGNHTTYFDQYVKLHFAPVSQLAKAGADFFPDKRTSYGIHCDGSFLRRNNELDSHTKITKVDSSQVSILHQDNLIKGDFKNGGAGFYFNRKMDSLGTELSVNGDYLDYHNRSFENYTLHFLDANENETASPNYQRSHPSTDIAIYVGQMDFTHPFKKKYKVEAGIKSSYVKTSNDLLFETSANADTWQKDLTRTNSFIYSEQINAAYISGSADMGKWQIQAGLRGEQTFSTGDSPTTNQLHKNNYVQLFPTLFVSQKISDKHSFQYTLARRINRPAYDELNPFFFYVDQYLYKVGNPFLQPEISNNADITYDYKDFLFVSIGGSRTTGGIAHVTHLVDSTGVVNQSVVNMNTIDNCYVNITFSKSFTKWWTTETNFTVAYNRYKANLSGQNLDKGSIGYGFTTTESFLLAKGWKMEASGWYQSGAYYSLFYIKSSADVSLGVSKSFLKNKLKCSVNISDLIYTQPQRVVVDFEDQHINSTYNFDSRFVYLRMRYNFGQNDSFKKSQNKDAADDLKNRVG